MKPKGLTKHLILAQIRSFEFIAIFFGIFSPIFLFIYLFICIKKILFCFFVLKNIYNGLFKYGILWVIKRI